MRLGLKNDLRRVKRAAASAPPPAPITNEIVDPETGGGPLIDPEDGNQILDPE